MVNNYKFVLSVNLINHTIITNSQAITRLRIFQFFGLHRKRIFGEAFNCVKDFWNILSVNSFKIMLHEASWINLK